jgi:HPt (histidine-containing phosphotransfer) domain-containing protein
MGNDVDLFREMVGFFREDAPQYLAEIQAARKSGDFGAVKRAAHTLKGLVLNFGAVRATSAAMALELLAASALTEPAEQVNFQAATEELEAAIAELQKALENPQAVSNGEHRKSNLQSSNYSFKRST